MSPQKPIHPHLRELLALSLVPQLGAQRIRLLLQSVDHPQDIFRMERGELERTDGIGPVIAGKIRKFNGWPEVDKLVEQTEKSGSDVITCLDETYPPLLGEIYDPPIVLWIQGNPSVLSMEAIAVVGTRQASKYGIKMAKQFTRELVGKGLVIVSGLAYGIDAVAHQTTLNSNGKTVAVLGSGIDVIYPNRHIRMAHEIMERGGAIISEFIPGSAPDASNFPVRNRIVSGLTFGTLVIESGIKGGSMITARSALDQNREVFVVPHPLIGSGAGCNAIIKRGWGKLVQNVDDILNEIPVSVIKGSGPIAPRECHWKSLELDETSQKICKILESSTRHIDELSEKLGLPSGPLLSKLLELEMLDCIQQTAGKNFELK